MEKIKNLRILCLFIISLFISEFVYSQDVNNVWIVGIGINAVDYFPTNSLGNGNDDGFLNEIFNIEDHWNISGPQIMATRYLINNLSVDGLLAFNNIKKYGDTSVEKTNYIGFDINFRYSFMDTSKAFTIFALVGGGYTFAFYSGGTVNGGGGMNYWISDTIGLHTQAIYKYNSSNFKLNPHFYYSLSLVFKLQAASNFTWRDGK
jgi:hypothetical protein